jgi:hypothetical protein
MAVSGPSMPGRSECGTHGEQGVHVFLDIHQDNIYIYIRIYIYTYIYIYPGQVFYRTSVLPQAVAKASLGVTSSLREIRYESKEHPIIVFPLNS